MHQETIENYLKTIYHLSDGNSFVVTNKDLADRLHVIPATVTEAVKKLHALKLVEYEKSYGTRLTNRKALNKL
jgi:DtxR family Mn-dependent transcriptional regulator